MSIKYPVIAVTGSSGSGTSTAKTAFEHIFFRENVNACIVEGDSFHRFNREEIPQDTDVLLDEGLHGAVVTEETNVARHVDLLIGVVPIVNLEWIQKIHRDTQDRGYQATDVTDNILRRMHDYVRYITPQFSTTDINFQRVPTVDTSNPFIARDIPTADESFIVIRFRDPAKFEVEFPFLLSMLGASFMSRRNTIVIPGGKMGFAMEIILALIIDQLMNRRRGSFESERQRH
jgi:phosphoribulokinase